MKENTMNVYELVSKLQAINYHGGPDLKVYTLEHGSLCCIDAVHWENDRVILTWSRFPEDE